MKTIYGQHTEKGLRSENQDAIAINETGSLALFAVADGAGGLSHGRWVSDVAVRAMASGFSCCGASTPEDLITHILEKYRQVNEYINSRQLEMGEKMATTLSMLHFLDNYYIASNVGDTQILLFRGAVCELVSQVHNVAWINYLNGEIAYEEIPKHEGNHILTRALGGCETIKPYASYGTAEPGDLFLICTDGVCNHVGKDEIYDLSDGMKLKTMEQMNGFCRELVRMALRNGSTDNCSVIAVKVPVAM